MLSHRYFWFLFYKNVCFYFDFWVFFIKINYCPICEVLYQKVKKNIMKTFLPQRAMCCKIVTLQAIKLLSPIFCFLLIYSFFIPHWLQLLSPSWRSYFLLLSLPPREYWRIYRGSGFLVVVWFGSTHLLPLPWASCLSFSVFLCVAGRAYWLEKGGCVGEEPNHSTARKQGLL